MSGLVYGLVDPRTQLIRYIGQSSTGMRRPRSHRTPSTLKRNQQYSGNWIRELQASGYEYQIVVLETKKLSDAAKAREQRKRDARGV